ncbi:MAG: hypothetical protein Q7W16_03430 [Coriobacteriia bacterium]|nr:hypothetical protein [Coriobacteriia bacterium]
MADTSTSDGWHSDPLGRYDQRYMKSGVWTSQVTRDGFIQEDPVPGVQDVGAGTVAEASPLAADAEAPTAPPIGRAWRVFAFLLAALFAAWALIYGFSSGLDVSAFGVSALLQPLLWGALALAAVADYRARTFARCAACKSTMRADALVCPRCGGSQVPVSPRRTHSLVYAGVTVLAGAALGVAILVAGAAQGDSAPAAKSQAPTPAASSKTVDVIVTDGTKDAPLTYLEIKTGGKEAWRPRFTSQGTASLSVPDLPIGTQLQITVYPDGSEMAGNQVEISVPIDQPKQPYSTPSDSIDVRIDISDSIVMIRSDFLGVMDTWDRYASPGE